MGQHEAFLKGIRVEPNDPFHEHVYGDFLRDEGRDPPDEYIALARKLAQDLHAAKRSFRLPPEPRLGLFGLEVLLDCSHLHALEDLSVAGGLYRGHPLVVMPNIGDEGVERLAHWPVLDQIIILDVRYNRLGERAVEALVACRHLRSLEELRVHEPDRPLADELWRRLEDRFGHRLRGER